MITKYKFRNEIIKYQFLESDRDIFIIFISHAVCNDQHRFLFLDMYSFTIGICRSFMYQ